MTVFCLLLVAGLIYQQIRIFQFDSKLKDAKEAAARAKAAFFATMNHELRTPITAIIGFTELLIEEAKIGGRTGEVNDLCKVNDSAQALLRMINDVLLCAAVNSDGWRGEVTDFSFNELIQEIVDGQIRRLTNSAVSIKTSLATEIPKVVRADVTAVHKIISSLLDNSVKFTKSGQILLTTALVKANERDITIRCSLDDTGVGFDTESIPRLFKAFEAGDNSLTKKFGGVGVGLSIAKALVRRMGGTIQAKSVVNKGSTFIFTLVLQKGVSKL